MNVKEMARRGGLARAKQLSARKLSEIGKLGGMASVRARRKKGREGKSTTKGNK